MTEEFYSDIERALLQYIISTHPVRQEQLVQIHRKFREDYANDSIAEETVLQLKERPLETSLEMINNKLHPLGFEVAHARSQNTNDVFYTYSNTLDDLSSQSATTFSKPEIEIIKAVLEEIFSDPEESYHISSTLFIRMCQKEGKSALQAEQFMHQLTSAGWFDMERGHLALGIRSLTELKRRLISDFGTKSRDDPNGLVAMCFGCKDICTKGVKGLQCREGCWIRFHTSCKETYNRTRRNEEDSSICPSCSEPWEPAPIGRVPARQNR